MKIRDIVYLVQDRTIVKTKILGIRQLLEKPKYEEKEKIVTTYFVRDGSTRSREEKEGDWYEGSDIVGTLEEAQKVIEDNIQKEVLEELNKISIMDTTHE
jgi:nitrogen fixation protein FixH